MGTKSCCPLSAGEDERDGVFLPWFAGVDIGYPAVSPLKSALDRFEAVLVDEAYGERVNLRIKLPREHADALRETVAALTDVAARVAVPELTEATGSIEPWARVSPGTKIMGRTEQVRVRAGDRVGRGDVLARLEKRDLEAAVELARASVSMAEARLELARAYAQAGELAQARELYRGNIDETVRAIQPGNPEVRHHLHELACIAALVGEEASALQWLGRAVDEGLEPDLLDDPALSNLQGNPRFKAMLAEARAGATDR